MTMDYALLATARLLLLACRPLKAHAMIVRLGRMLPQLHTPEEVRRVASRLAGHGTCLAQCLAIAARAPSAEIVIGVSPADRPPLFAHAWIEMNGEPVDAASVAGSVIARIPARPLRDATRR